MSTTDSTWGDTGFGVGDDGFMPNPPTPDPESSHEAQIDTPATDAPELETDSSVHRDLEGSADRVRIEPVSALPPIAPLPPTPRTRRPLLWIGIAALLALLIAVIGVEWYISSHPSIEEQAFRAPEDPLPEGQRVDAAMQLTQEDIAAVDTATAAAVEATTSSTSTIGATVDTRPATMDRSETSTSTVAPTKPAAFESTSPVAKEPTTRTSTASAKGPAWVVQVFASPSRDDAEEWLQQLREQRVPDGYIVEQKVKGQPWYRVRFGQYATRDEAEQAAMNRGFRQPWIARVR